MSLTRSEDSFANSDLAGGFSTTSLVDALAKVPAPKVDINCDCAVPKQIALKYEAAGVKKGKELDFWTTMLLALHAGAFVSFGAGFFTVVHSVDPAFGPQVSYGLLKFAGGISFCTGLAMVILCGSELFTGNTMLILAWCTRRISTYQMFRNLFLAYLGNFIGSLIIAALQLWGRTYENAQGQVGITALGFAEAKCARDWGQCYALGILCNIIVCWSVWMTLASREAIGKLIVFILPITSFAASGYEHSVANMYFLPIAMMIKTYAPDSYWLQVKVNKNQAYPHVSVGTCIWWNYVPSTLGNATGAMVFLGIVYWYVFLRDSDHQSRFEMRCCGIKWFGSPPWREERAARNKGKKKKHDGQ